jgi:hypothetical protein
MIDLREWAGWSLVRFRASCQGVAPGPQMAEDLDPLEEILLEVDFDLNKSEAMLAELHKTIYHEHAEIVGFGPPSNVEYLDFIISRVKANGESYENVEKTTLDSFNSMYLTLAYVSELNHGLLGCIKSIADSSLRRSALRRLSMLSMLAMRVICNIPSNASGHRFALSKQAKAAREKRAASPREIALIAAIEAELAPSILRPSKEAEAILDAVNLRLGANGFAPVKVDVVRRRLERRAALLKSAEQVSQ